MQLLYGQRPFLLSWLFRATAMALLLWLSACTHSQHVALDATSAHQVKVIGIPQFETQPRIDIRQENIVYAVIGVSAKVVQQVVREAKRIKYENRNPDLQQQCMDQMRNGIKHRLGKLGYKVVDLEMSYWQALSGYRKKNSKLKNIDAVLHIQTKQFGYYSASPLKPYRPGMVLAADLVTMEDRNTISSNVYNIGFGKDDVSLISYQVAYATNVYVADERYFYRNFKTLLKHAKQSSGGLKYVSRVAAESIAGDLGKHRTNRKLARR